MEELQKVVFIMGSEIRSLQGEVVKEDSSWIWLKTLSKIDRISQKHIVKIENVSKNELEGIGEETE